MAIQVNDVPALPGSILGSPAVCQGTSGVVYSIAAVPNATGYIWSVPSGAGVVLGAGTTSITVDYGLTALDGNVTVYATNACGNGPTAVKAVTVNVKPATPVIAAPFDPTTFCEGGNALLTGPTMGFNYQWTPGGSTSQNNLVTTSGNYSVVITDPLTGCSSASSNVIVVTVKPAPAAPSSTGFITQCWNGIAPVPTLDASTNASVPAGSVIDWYDSATGGSLIIGLPVLVGPGTITYYAEARSIATGCLSLHRTPVVLTISTNPNAPLAGSNQTVCEQSPIQTITATATPPAGSTLLWFTAPTGGTPVSPTLSVVGTKTFYAEATNGICSSLTRSAGVILTINPAPAAPVSGGNITECIAIPAAQTLTATATAPVGSTVQWWTAPTGGSLVVGLPTLAALGTTTYYAESVNTLTGCASLTRTAVTLSIVLHPAPPVPDPDIVKCQEAPLQTLTATATVPSGSTVKWYTAPSGGSTVTPTLHAVGTVTYYASTDNGLCESLTRVPVTLTINPSPAPPVSMGDVTQCENKPVIQTLTALASPAGSIWYTTPAGGSPVTPTLNIVGSATYYAESRLGSCPSLTRSAPVVLTIKATPVKPVSNGDVTECQKSPLQTLTATATPPSGSVVKWYTSATGGVAIGTPTLNAVSTITYYAESDNGTCHSVDRTAVVLTISPAPAAPVSLGNITDCEKSPFVSLTAAASAPGASTIVWYTSPTGGSPVATPQLINVGTVTYYAESLFNGCTSTTRSAPIVLTIDPTPAAPTPDSPVPGLPNQGEVLACATNPVQTLTATATAPSGSTVRWYLTATGGTPIAGLPTRSSIGEITYYAESYNGKCSSFTRTPVRLNIYALPAAPISLGDITACENQPVQILTAAATNVTAGSVISWYSVPVGGIPVATPTLNEIGTATYYAEASVFTETRLGSCASLVRSKPVVLTINPRPADPVSAGDVIVCAANPIQLITAAVIAPPAGVSTTWYDAATGGNVVTKPTLNSISTISYWAEAKLGNCTSLGRTKVTLTIQAIPLAPVLAVKGVDYITDCQSVNGIDATTAFTSVAGVYYKWFDSPIGGAEVSSIQTNVGTRVVYGESRNVTTDCPSVKRTKITLTINPVPAAPVSGGDQIVCSTTPIQTLTATATVTAGSVINWYTVATGGTKIVGLPTLNLLNTTQDYYAEADNGTCKSSRTKVTLRINAVPPAPALKPANLLDPKLSPWCRSNPIIETLDANDQIVKDVNFVYDWYLNATGGTPLDPIDNQPILSTSGKVTYYAEARIPGTGCTSSTRTAVLLVITSTPSDPVSGGDITACASNPVQTLTATATSPDGATIVWFSDAAGLIPVTRPVINTVTSRTYYARAITGSCSSNLVPVKLEILAVPTPPVADIIPAECAKSPIQKLTATATKQIDAELLWYNVPTGGLPVDPTLNQVGTVTLYAEAVKYNIGKSMYCTSLARSKPTVLTINETPAAPVGGPITACVENPVQTLTATATVPPGVTILWYAAATGGAPINKPVLNKLGSVDYYAEALKGSCVSLTRTKVTLALQTPPLAPVLSGLETIGGCYAAMPTGGYDALNAVRPVTGVHFRWFDAATSGNEVSSIQNVVGTRTVYAEARNDLSECPSVSRTKVILNVSDTPANLLPESPTANNPAEGAVTECAVAPLQTLTAKVLPPPPGVAIVWYDAPLLGNVVASPTWNAIGQKSYWAEAKSGNCLSVSRTKVTLTIYDIPVVPLFISNLTDCEKSPLQTLDANNGITKIPGTTVVWYDQLTNGFVATPTLNYIGTKTFYAVTETANGSTACQSAPRLPVKLTIQAAPPVPVSTGDINECVLNAVDANKAIVQNKAFNLIWYDQATGGAVVVSPTLNRPNLTATFYAAYQDPVTKCESLTRTSVTLTLYPILVATASSNSPLSPGRTLYLNGGPKDTKIPTDFTYLWSAPNGLTYSTANVTIPNVSAANSGTYSLTVTSKVNGCTSNVSIQVLVLTATAGYQPVCMGGTLNLTALPDGMKSYDWTGPNGFTKSLQNPYIDNISTLGEGIYTLWVTDQSGNRTTTTVDVKINPLPTPFAMSNSPVCPSGTLQLRGGPDGMTSYSWSGPGLTPTIGTIPDLDIITPVEGNYALTVTDANGCSATDVVAVTILVAKPTYVPLCSGDVLRLIGEPNGLAKYAWSGPNGFKSNQQSPTLQKVTSAEMGTYTLTVTDKTGCNSLPVTMDVAYNMPNATIAVSPNTNPICEGTDITLTGGPAGNAGQYTYLWTGPNGYTSILQNPPVISKIATVNAGTYTLKVTANSGCTSTASVNLVVSGVTFNGTYGPYCVKDIPVPLSVNQPGVDFTGNGVTGSSATGYKFDPKAAGVGIHAIAYTYTNASCTISNSLNIEVVDIPVVVTHTVVLASCTGTTTDITLPAITAGSTPGLVPFTYWTDIAATIPVVNPKAVPAGIYYILGATPSGRCFDIQSVTVSQPDVIHASIQASKQLDCPGDLTGTLSVKVSTGGGGYTYLWSTLPAQITATATNLGAGIYTVVVTDVNMCTTSFTGEITEPAPLKLKFNVKNIQCLSDANGTARVDSINGSGDLKILNSYKYLWNTSPVQTTREAVRLTAWWHKVSLTNDKGCVEKDSVFVDVKDTIHPTITCPKDIDMSVQYIKSTDGSPNKYIVDLGKPFAGDNCAVDTITNDAPAKFRVGETKVKWTVTDQMGLTDTCTQIVKIKEIPTIPQLISPNGDGVNDTFIIDGLEQFPNTMLMIFTRSGQLVFQNKNYELPENAWNGRYSESSFSKNKLVAPGVYYYILRLGGNSSQTMKGFVYVYY